MNLTRRRFALMLAMTPGVGGRTLTRILARNDLLNRTPEDFLSLSPEAMVEEYKVGRKSAALLSGQKQMPAQIAELERRLDGLGVRLATAADAHFPSRVESMDANPPCVLFLYGNQKLLSSKTFAVLSSRNAPPKALDEVEQLAEAGVLAGEILVSGHDRPEYQRSAIVPLRWGAPRILVLDRGLFKALGDDLKDEPFRAARLWRYQFDPQTDLVISPFRPNSDFTGINNQVRDRLIACLADRLDFPWLAKGGNMEKLARMALRAGRSVRTTKISPLAESFERIGASIL